MNILGMMAHLTTLPIRSSYVASDLICAICTARSAGCGVVRCLELPDFKPGVTQLAFRGPFWHERDSMSLKSLIWRRFLGERVNWT
jgi:hypothetical protein